MGRVKIRPTVALFMSPTVSALLGLASALAADPDPAPSAPAGATIDELVAMLDDENARYKLDAIRSALEASEHPFRARDVYALLDHGATPEMTRIAATKAQIFWDGSARSLPAVVAEGRASAPAETVEIRDNASLVVVFETFNDVLYARKAVEERVGELGPRLPHEDDNKVDQRIRDRDLALAVGLAPLDGKVDGLTFHAVLAGTFTQHDGRCTKAVVTVDLSNVSLDLFRYTLGGRKVEALLALGPSNVESARFSASGRYRFEAYSRPICVSAEQAYALLQQGSTLEITFRRPHDSDAWTGAGTFTNAKTRAKL